MLEKLKNEPVRIYGIVAAAMAIVAHYVPDIPTPLWLGLAAAILGLGEEVVRSKVTPNGRVIVHENDLFDFGEAVEYGNEDTAWRAD